MRLHFLVLVSSRHHEWHPPTGSFAATSFILSIHLPSFISSYPTLKNTCQAKPIRLRGPRLPGWCGSLHCLAVVSLRSVTCFTVVSQLPIPGFPHDPSAVYILLSITGCLVGSQRRDDFFTLCIGPLQDVLVCSRSVWSCEVEYCIFCSLLRWLFWESTRCLSSAKSAGPRPPLRAAVYRVLRDL